VVKKEEKKPR